MGNVMALAAHREKVGNAKGAVAVLDAWLETHHDDLQVRQKIAQVRGASEDIDGAIEEYRVIVNLDDGELEGLAALVEHQELGQAVATTKGDVDPRHFHRFDRVRRSCRHYGASSWRRRREAPAFPRIRPCPLI